uniref:Protein furry C-terminal domain-containing protein n=1 Tax=Periophthalmus magnuspinnatus TaxID=409849 RepID=A0A3B4AZA0_9GOBI
FLDVELEDAEGESMDNFNWGVRRRSLESMDKGDGDGDTPSLQECQYSGSTPSLNLTNHEDTDESSEEEVLSASQILNRTRLVSPNRKHPCPPCFPHNDTASNHVDSLQQSQESSTSALTEEHPVLPSSLPSLPHLDSPSLQHLDSPMLERDEGDADCFPEVQASPPPSPFLSAILAAFQPVAYDNEEDAWRCHVNQMLSDSDGSCAVYTFHVFSRLFQNIQRKFGSITHASVRFLGERLQRMGNQFLSSLEVMTSHSQCPTVLLDAETLVSCGLLETLKFSVLELQDPNEMCLLLLFQAYCKLISRVDTIKREAEVTNMSEELSLLESCLKEAELGTDVQEDVCMSDHAHTSTETAIQSLIETLRARDFSSALTQVKVFRSLWPNDIFGNESDNAVQTLLHIYFRHQTLGQTGCLAVVGPSRDLSQASARLMELNLQIREALSRAQAPPTIISTGL